MTTTIKTDLVEKQKFTQDAIKELYNQSNDFCSTVGEITKLGVDFYIGNKVNKIPVISQIPSVRETLKYVSGDLAGQYAESLCNTYIKNLDNGKFCPVPNQPLTQTQKDIALDLLNGKVDGAYLQSHASADVKIAAQSVQQFTKSTDYNSQIRQTAHSIKTEINKETFVIPSFTDTADGLDTDSLLNQIDGIHAEETSIFDKTTSNNSFSDILSDFQSDFLNSQTLSIVTARLIMGEDLDKIAADMATRAVFRAGIKELLEEMNIPASTLQGHIAQGISTYAATIIITNAFYGGMNSNEYAKAAANVSIQTITTNERLYA